MIGCLETTSFGPWHVVASMTACYDSLDCLWGSLSHRFSNEEQELVWHVRWISDVSFYIALFWIGTTTGCTFSVCRFQTCDVLLAQQSTDSVRHGTVPQYNQLIKCNVAMYSTASASTLFRPYSFVSKFWIRSSWVIRFAINEYCCLSKPLFPWIHSQSVLIHFCWKWKWKVRSGSRSKTGIFPGWFVLSTNVWTGGYLVFKSF